jgi:uncharacterized protein YegL
VDTQSAETRPVAQRPRPLPVIVLADVSGSMAEDGKIDVLNASLTTMIGEFAAEDSLRGEIWVGVVTFGGQQATLHQRPVPATALAWTDLAAGGRTPLGHAIDLVTDLLRDDEVIPPRSFLPTLALVSDGVPTDDWHAPLDRLLASPRGAKAVRLAVGVGREMDEEAFGVLSAFTGNPDSVVPAEEVQGLTRFFSWVTMSVTTRVRSGRPDDPGLIQDSNTIDPDDLLDLMS